MCIRDRVWTHLYETWTPTDQEKDQKQRGTGFLGKRNAVWVVGVFGQHLSRKNTKKHTLYHKIAKKVPIQAFVMVYNMTH